MLKLCECLDNQSIKITTRFSGSIVTSLDSVNGWSIQTLLRGHRLKKGVSVSVFVTVI